MNSINEINEYLQSKEIMFSIFESSKNVSSLAESAKSRGQKIDQILRSLLFHLPKKRFIMVVIAGNYRVNWKLLRNFIGENRISLATPEEVIYETNYQLGAVCPFLIKHNIPVFLDQTCFDNDTISIGSGIAHTAIMMKSQDLLKVLPESKVVSFANQVDIE